MPLPKASGRWGNILKGILILVFGLVILAVVYALIMFLQGKVKEGFEGKSATVTYYYMDTCPHCKAMKPEWEKFKKMADGLSIVTKEISPESDPQAVRKADVSGFPTVHVDVNGKNNVYEGDRTGEALMTYVSGLLKA